MAASLHPLSLPPPPRDIGGEDGGDGDETDTSIRGWDRSVLADLPDDLHHNGNGRRSADEGAFESLPIAARARSATFHAVAHGRSVVGTSPGPLGGASSKNEGDEDMTDGTDESRGILWQTSLDDEVVAVASNPDGSVVAAATATHVSLLKGRDGSVLATRQITDDEGGGAGACPPRLLFLSNNNDNNEGGSSDREDILAVVCPVAPGNHSGRSNVILIGNIDGNLLNSPDMAHVREGASQMSMELLPFDSSDSRSVAWMEGAFVNPSTVRLFLGLRGEGIGPSASVCVYDYDVSEKKSRRVLDDLGGHLGHVDGSTALMGAGIDDNRPMGVHLLLASATAGEASSSSAISWINVVDLNTSAKYQLPQGAAIVSCAPIQSHGNEAEGEYVAAALACRGPAGSEMVVVQSMVRSDCQEAEGDAMVLLQLSVEDANDDVEVYAPNTIDGRGPYSFRYRNSRRMVDDATVGACWEFAPNDQSRLGTLHSLLVQKRFEDAHGVAEEMAQRSPDGDGDRVSSPMDKTLVSLMHFRHILSGDIASETNQAEALECLRRLTTGVIASSGEGRELEGMASAADYLVGWPKNQPGSSTRMYSIREVSTALVAMSTAIKTAVDVVGASKAMELEEQRQRLDERLMALKALKGIIPAFDAAKIACDEPYLAVASTVELLSLFVAKGAFKAAEELQGSEFGKEAGLSRPDVLAGAALRLPVTVDPRAFVAWLSDIVLPSMPSGHPMLGKIRSWACSAADKYDEEDIAQGIDSSIELLQAVAAATACQTETNRCYDYATEQDLDEEDMNDSITPRNGDPASSFCTTSSTRSVSSYRPSVLSVGMISGGAAKRGNGGRTMMSARRRAGRVSNNSSLDFSFLSPTSSSPGSTEASFAEEEEDEEDENINCVESKLREALRLKAARRLGLERDRLTLTNYPSKGEEYIMKELVRSALDKSSTEPSCDLARVVSELRSYADSVGADFDEALCSIANELCNDNTDDIPTVLRQTEKLSEWCSTPSKKCSIVLRMLRKALVSVNRPPDLSSLASGAIGLAADDETRSELKEAARLLAIDSLVRKYCGNGAQEYFRVSDPLHGLKLVQHVCRHIHKSTVLADALMLCDAFTHVSKLDTCVSLLQRVMASQTARKTVVEDPTHSAAQCASFMSEIYSRDAILAERVGERMAGYCAGMLEDCRKAILLGAFPGKEEAKRQAAVSTSVACSVLSVMRDQHASVAPRMLREFQQLSKLQSGCGIFLTIEELRDPSSRVEVVTDLLKPCVELLRRGSLKTEDDSLRQELKPLIAMARQWTAILCDAPSDVSQLWSRAIGTAASQIAKVSTNHASLLLLEVSGLLVGQDGHSSFHSLMSVALSLCDRASSEAHGLSRSMSLGETDLLISLVAMRSMAQASLLLRDYVLLHSPSDMLPTSLALANLTELVCDISTQSDKGIGEKLERYIETQQTLGPKRLPQTQGISEKSARMMTDKRIPSAPNLHPTWYIGDGLLLQPLDALFLSVAYFKMMRGLESSSPSNAISSSANPLMSKSDMLQALESRGAHATSLRVLVLSMATAMPQSSSQSPFPNAEGILKKNHGVLAERSLGGTELGFTCGNIDVLMSASFLLHLPKEQAFKIYRAALPSAISERDFSRIVTLASIGMHCGVGAFSSGESFPWSKQRRFIDQCRDLSLNAIWWRILSQYGVSFDPAAFSQSDESKASVDMQAYCEKLVWSAAPTKLGPRSTLKLARRFMKDYGLNKQAPTSSLIEFLLSAPHCDSANTEQSEARLNKNDIRRDLRQTESVVRECLVLLPTLNQSRVLRKCVMNLEKDQRCAKDYDRHSLILQLYRECLDKLSPVMKKNAVRAKAHEQETGCIDRRQDALVVISSIFEKYPSDKRPEYTKLFEPLPPDPLNPGHDTRKLSVLGAEAGDCVVDPLAPLDGILEDENGSNSIVAALAPLCSLLQLPAGYLHARSLVVRFRKLKATGGVLPPFDAAVVPVAKKLKATRDRADLAWWCSLQYAAGSVEQLKCLDMAHSNATDASELAESQQDPEEESVALERVKRIDAARAGLSDKILVEQVLQRHESTTNAVKTLYRSIIDKVQQQAQTEENYCPEHLVRALLIEGSQIAATASLDDTDAFSTHHFRSLALIVHDACKSLSSRYSHVSVGKCVRLLTRRWLVHGDELEDNFDVDPGDRDDPTNNTTEEQAKNNVRANDENEDTSEFVMDIGMISAGEQHWSNDQARNGNSGPGTTSNIEPSALRPNSPRESSDHLCLRVALRIAFLVCFAEDYHRATDSLPEKSTALEDIDTNVKRHKLKPRSKGALKSRHKSACFEGDLALQHARELLGIVFARQGSTIASAYGSLFDESAAFDESMLSTVPEHSAKEEFHGKNKALSFAMRYRALRVATILCPQEVIMRVAVEESYGSDFGDDHLHKCAFGSFVAMEIEALKLALPHSDLIQFSTVNFPSYARTLWRNYGGNSSHGVYGRLHLLLLELCINDRSEVDWDLFVLMFGELTRLELPRSLLLACEIAAKSKAIALAASQKRLDVLQSVEDATNKIAEFVVNEVKANLGAATDISASECHSTLHRLVLVVINKNIHTDPTCIVQMFIDASSSCKEQGQEAIGDVFSKAAIRITDHLTEPGLFCSTRAIINGCNASSEWYGRSVQQSSACDELVASFENSFY